MDDEPAPAGATHLQLGSIGSSFGAALSAAIQQASNASPLKPSTPGMRAEIAACLAATNDEQELLAAIDELFIKEQRRHAREIERVQSRAQYKQADLEKKMAMQRDASKTEGKHVITQLEQKHRDAQAMLRQEMDELRQEYEEALADQAGKAAETERLLLQKLTVLDGGAAAAELERQRTIDFLSKSAARRMQNAELSRGWESWKSWCNELLQMKYAVARMMKAGLSKSWNAWVEMCDIRVTQQRLLAAAATRMTKPMLAAAYTRWRRDWEIGGIQDEMEVRVKALEIALHKQREEFDRERERLKAQLQEAEEREVESKREEVERLQYTAVRRMLNQQLALGWMSWVTMWENMLHWKQSISGAALRIRHRQTMKAWDEWLAVYERDRAARLCTTAAGRLRNRDLAKGFAAWIEWSEFERLNDMFIAAGLRLRHRDLFRGWDAWTAAWKEEVRKRVKAAALARMRNLEVARAFGAWTEMWEEHLQRMQALRKSVIKLRFPKLSASFTHWSCDWKESVRLGLENVRRLPTWDEIEEREQALEAKMEDLIEQLNATKMAAQNSDAVVAHQNVALEKLTKECDALRLQVQKGTDQILQLRADADTQIGQKNKELATANEDARAMAIELASMREQLIAFGTPLATQERRQILRSNLSDMKRQMEQITERAADNHSESVRGLTNLIALRERQLLRVSSSPRLTNPHARPHSASVRPQLDGKPLQSQPPRAATSTSLGVAAGLFVAPTFPEAGPKVGEQKRELASKLQKAVQRATALWGTHEADDIDQVLHGRLYGGATMSNVHSDVALVHRRDTCGQTMSPAKPDQSVSLPTSPMQPRSARCPQPSAR